MTRVNLATVEQSLRAVRHGQGYCKVTGARVACAMVEASVTGSARLLAWLIHKKPREYRKGPYSPPLQVRVAPPTKLTRLLCCGSHLAAGVASDEGGRGRGSSRKSDGPACAVKPSVDSSRHHRL